MDNTLGLLRNICILRTNTSYKIGRNGNTKLIGSVQILLAQVIQTSFQYDLPFQSKSDRSRGCTLLANKLLKLLFFFFLPIRLRTVSLQFILVCLLELFCYVILCSIKYWLDSALSLVK